MLSFIRRLKTAIPAIVISVLLMASLACGSSGAPTRATSAPPPFGGRFLLLREGGPYELLVLELELGSTNPQVLWSDLPGAFSEPESDFYTINPLVSPGGEYAVLPGSLVVVNLATGEQHAIALPGLNLTTGDHETIPIREALHNVRNHRNFRPAFSPTSRYLAYSLSGERPPVYAESGLYLLDLTDQTVTTLFEGPCAEYTGHGTICGDISWPVWLDETTLAFASFAGEMPEEVTWPAMPELIPNHTTVLTTEGAILQEFEQPLGIDVAGQTAVIYSELGAVRLEVAELKQGTTSGAPIDGDFVLSPDGRFAYFGEEGKLVELRTGSTTTIASYSLDFRGDIRWSPDGGFIAFWNEISDELTIISLEGGPAGLLIDLDDVSDRNDWWLLGWVP